MKVNHIDINVCGYVFDEIYFPVDAAKDLRQPAESYFDPEPPLAKLLMAPPIAFFGFNSWTWRLSTTLFGSLLVGMMYLVALRLRRDRFFAIATALFICFDGLAFVESRTGVIDIIAIFFVALFYYVFLLHWQARTRAQWRTTLYVMAGVAGLAFGAKLTALAPLIVAAGLILARGLSPYLAAFIPWLRRIAGPGRAETIMWRNAAGPRAVLHYFVAGIVAVAIFFACFSRYETIQHTDVYFFTGCNPAVAGLPGTAKTLDVPVMKVGPLTVPNPVKAVDNIIQITAASLRYHAEECHSHPYSSLWLTWPIMEHPVLFYASSHATNGAGCGDHRHGQSRDLVARHPRAAVLRVAGDARTELVATARPHDRPVSLAAMMIIYQAAVRFHDPNNFNTSYTAAQFITKFHMATVVAVRDRANVSGDLVRRRVRRRRHLRRARDALRGHLAALRAGLHRARLLRVLDDVGAGQRAPRALLLSRARHAALHGARACVRADGDTAIACSVPRQTGVARTRQLGGDRRACSPRSSSSTRSGRRCPRAPADQQTRLWVDIG